MAQTKPKSDEIQRVLLACRDYFVVAALFSLAINLLYLASPLYMLQVYDRVISSASQTTLVMLTLALLLAFVALAALDALRARVLTRGSIRLDRLLAGRVVAATVDLSTGGVARSQPLRDFDNFRQFITGAGIHAIFDLPWAPIYIGVIFLLHPLLGAFAFGSATVLVPLLGKAEFPVPGERRSTVAGQTLPARPAAIPSGCGSAARTSSRTTSATRARSSSASADGCRRILSSQARILRRL